MDLKNMLMGLIKNLKTNYYIQIQYVHCDSAGKNVDFE